MPFPVLGVVPIDVVGSGFHIVNRTWRSPAMHRRRGVVLACLLSS